MNDAVAMLPANVRRIVYVVLALVSLLLTAAGAGWAVSPYPVPWWVGAGLAAVGVLAAPFGVLAASNTPTAPTGTMTYGGDGANGGTNGL